MKRIIRVTVNCLIDVDNIDELNEDIMEDLRCTEYLNDFDFVEVEDKGEYRE